MLMSTVAGACGLLSVGESVEKGRAVLCLSVKWRQEGREYGLLVPRGKVEATSATSLRPQLPHFMTECEKFPLACSALPWVTNTT